MDRRPWLDLVEREMARQGLPAHTRYRLVAEWRDHLTDLMEEGISMTDLNAKMGEPVAVASGAAEQFRQTSWVRRHPILTFVLTPLPMTLLIFIALTITMQFIFAGIALLLYGTIDSAPRSFVVAAAYSLTYAVRFIPFVLLTLWYTRLYYRSGVHRELFVVALTQILMFAGSVISNLQYSEIPGQSQWVLSLAILPLPMGDGWGLPFLTMVGWAQLLQVLIPLALVAATMVIVRRREKQLVIVA